MTGNLPRNLPRCTLFSYFIFFCLRTNNLQGDKGGVSSLKVEGGVTAVAQFTCFIVILWGDGLLPLCGILAR